VRAAVRAVLDEAGVVTDYVALVDGSTFQDVTSATPGASAVLAVAGTVGVTRLIDNTDVSWA
jgi:pantothenate synthetase